MKFLSCIFCLFIMCKSYSQATWNSINDTKNLDFKGDLSSFKFDSSISVVASTAGSQSLIWQNTIGLNTKLQFQVEYLFAPSTSNKLEFQIFKTQISGKEYLLAWRIGESGSLDTPELWLSVNGTSTKLWRAPDGLGANAASFNLSVLIQQNLFQCIVKPRNQTPIYAEVAHSIPFPDTFVSTTSLKSTLTSTNLKSKVLYDSIWQSPIYIDTIPPKVLRFYPLDSRFMAMKFSEPLDILNTHLNIEESDIQSLKWYGLDSCLIVLQNAVNSSMNLHAYLTDLSKNVSESFKRQYLPDFDIQTLRITEFVVDNDKVSPATQTEWIELYNPSSDTVYLLNWKLSTIRDSILLPNVIIGPKLAVVLGPSTLNFGLQIPNFPTLYNTEERIQIQKPNGRIEDRIDFETIWKTYCLVENTSSSKGMSFQRFDSEACSSKSNFYLNANASTSPGVFNPIQMPNYRNFINVTIDHIEDSVVTFKTDNWVNLDSAKCLVQEVEYMGSFRGFENGFEFKGIQDFPISGDFNLEIQGLQLCNKSDTFWSSTIQLPIRDTGNSIQLSEILYDPISGSYDWVELYNSSDKYIQLSDFSLVEHSLGLWDSIDSEVLPNYNFPPKAFKIVSRSCETLIQQYGLPKDNCIEVNIPDIPNSGNRMSIYNSNIKQYSEFVDVSDKLHTPFLQTTDGISLERTSYELDASNPSNWHSCASNRKSTPATVNSSLAYKADLPKPELCAYTTNFISANGDGLNDVFQIFCKGEGDQLASFRLLDIYGLQQIGTSLHVNFNSNLIWNLPLEWISDEFPNRLQSILEVRIVNTAGKVKYQYIPISIHK